VRSGRRRWLAVQALVSIVLLLLLMRRLDLTAFRALFLRLPVWFYLFSLAVILAGQVAYAWRWHVLLKAAGVRAPLSTVVAQYFIGICLANFFPSTVGGDLARVYYLGRDHGYRQVTASVVLDRILGIALLAPLASAAMWSVSPPSSLFATARLVVTAVAAASVAALVLAVAGTGGLAKRVGWMGPAAVRMAERLQRLRSDMEAALKKPKVVVQAAAVVGGYAFVIALLYVQYIWLVTGSASSVVMMFAVVTTTAVLSNIPISLNGLGLREQLHAALLVPLGIPAEVAVGISLLLFGHLLIASVIGLACWARAPALPADVRSASEML
jgi:uncharacterized protein (TIRG00374 family)